MHQPNLFVIFLSYYNGTGAQKIQFCVTVVKLITNKSNQAKVSCFLKLETIVMDSVSSVEAAHHFEELKKVLDDRDKKQEDLVKAAKKANQTKEDSGHQSYEYRSAASVVVGLKADIAFLTVKGEACIRKIDKINGFFGQQRGAVGEREA